MTYVRTGPPFDFQGSLTTSQKEEFYKWIGKRTPNFEDEQKWWQIQAHQLRKTSGVLEKWYKTRNDEPLETRWDKAPWDPSTKGYVAPVQRDCQIPSVVVGDIKSRFKEQLKRDDDAMFQMGHLRTLIEKAEDKAQIAKDAKKEVAELMTRLDTLFGTPAYEGVLVDDKALYKGKPKYRVSPLDPPTPWELDILVGSDTLIVKDEK